MENLIAAAAATATIISNFDACKAGRPDWKIWRTALDAAARDIFDMAAWVVLDQGPLACEDESGSRSMNAEQYVAWEAERADDTKMHEAMARLIAGQFGDISNRDTLLAAMRTSLTVNALGCRPHNVVISAVA